MIDRLISRGVHKRVLKSRAAAMSMRGNTKMSHLRILLRHFQSLQKRYRDREAAKKRWSMRAVGTIVDPDAHTIILLAFIGLLLLLNLFLRVPGVVETIAEYNKF